MIKPKFFFFALFLSLFLAACNEDEEPVPSGTFTVTIENVLASKTYLASGTTGFIGPGEQEQVTFHAGKGTYLSLATMFVQSNDLFFAFADAGLSLYDDNGNAISGDVTGQIDLWDAGTEVNEEPGAGPNQAPRQTGPNTGADENGTIQLVSNVNDGFTYPPDGDIIQITLSHDGGTEFTLTLQNISNTSSLPTPLAPGVWAVHNDQAKLFEEGTPADSGLEGIAEDGDNSTTEQMLTENTGYASPFAPGVWVVHENGVNPLFDNGSSDRGNGLEALAEDGDPSGLNTSLDQLDGVGLHGVFNTPEGASAPGPLLPGSQYTFTFDAKEGNYLSLATMLVHTNDLFYAFDGRGIALFNNGIATNGDVTTSLQLWDAGTEVNEYPGAGNNQPARGGGDSGPAENGNVRPVNDGFSYPSVGQAIRVTIIAN